MRQGKREYRRCFKKIAIDSRAVCNIGVQFLWDVNGQYVYFPVGITNGKRAKKRLYIDGEPTSTFVFNSWFDNWDINQFEIDFEKQTILRKVWIGV